MRRTSDANEPRCAARLLVIDTDDRTLLMHANRSDGAQPFWLAPGGGLEAGETYEAAASRELKEETGLSAAIGPWVWERRHVFEWNGKILDQYERFFVVRTSSFEVRPAKQDGYITGSRW